MSVPNPLPAEIPEEAVSFLQEMGWLDPDPLKVGDPAPDLELCRLDGGTERLADLWRVRPLVLVFGSYT